ncbi:MAG: hypothetical protein QOK43_3003 [Acidimicrobiaceae bacterium]|nr:hypothetical protein [Acidimicrobiaceae bacterium]
MPNSASATPTGAGSGTPCTAKRGLRLHDGYCIGPESELENARYVVVAQGPPSPYSIKFLKL